MNHKTTPLWYITALIICGAGFALFFALYVFPPFLKNYDVIGAFAAGFVNPFATGYSVDTITCWLILTIWIIYERKTLGIKYGWIAIILGVVPGVATGFALYLLLRLSQIKTQ